MGRNKKDLHFHRAELADLGRLLPWDKLAKTKTAIRSFLTHANLFRHSSTRAITPFIKQSIFGIQSGTAFDVGNDVAWAASGCKSQCRWPIHPKFI